jgi:bifunctional DNA-binding transcriptional regulator/antitoxin component of YhaV-PrlF toxin-antitoxin module
MEMLIVDAEGKVTIPPEVLHKRGLRPGDAVALIESAEGFFVYQGGVNAQTLAWWHALRDEEQQQAMAEARRYEALSEVERDALWHEGVESLEGDERELPALEDSV